MACSIPRNYRLYREIDRSGSCLFRSIVQAEADANGEGLLPFRVETERAKELRRSVVEYVYRVKDDRERYLYNTIWRPYLKSWHSKRTPNFNRKAYADWMSNSRTWGSELQLTVAALLLHRRICVHARGANSGYILGPVDGTHVPRNRAVLHLSLNGEHYEPYLPINVSTRSSRNAPPATSSRPTTSKKPTPPSVPFNMKNLYAELDRISLAQLKKLKNGTTNTPVAASRRKVRVRRRA